MGITRSDHAVKLWLKCWVLMAKTMVMVFRDSFTKDDYDELRDCLDNERKLLSQVVLKTKTMTENKAFIYIYYILFLCIYYSFTTNYIEHLLQIGV